MRQWISRREERGVFHQVIRELEVGDVVAYKEFFRMTMEQFSSLLGKVFPLIQKKEQPSSINSVRGTIQPDERLAVTLRYLATGETYHSLEYSFRISRQTISSIVSETSRALYKVFAPEYLKVTNTESEWDAVADKFEGRWNFPNGIGAIDGKRVIVQQPSNSGSHYYDYKGNNSIFLLAVFGPDYQCLWASAGTNGRSPDSAIWQSCDLKKALSLSHNTWNLPKPRPLPERAMPVP
ncbi:putative nuclease HARBI1 [Stylophora pistillata]|uniref:Putative nuclease HARBI1 n=2 Tax=Stylophora pistillata TaxID=50429 RepID=A0A2B4S9F7_STYPI|nr:putative nuclease HARBI1 [Stylophora pistillata]